MPHHPRIHSRVLRAGLVVALLGMAGLVLSACNTTAGLGEDMSAAGHAVAKTAEKVKQGM